MLMLIILVVTFSRVFSYSAVYPHDPKVEYLREPLAVDIPRPRLSWNVGNIYVNESSKYTSQSAYQILAASNRSILMEKPDMWDSGKISSGSHVHIRYDGKVPEPGQRVHWTVRIWDQLGNYSLYMPPTFWNRGYNESLWTAHWISAPNITQTIDLQSLFPIDREVIKSKPGLKPVVFLRKTFSLDSNIEEAKVYATAQGLYKLVINDEFEHNPGISDDLFTPGWTDYSKSIQYQVYDVTSLIRRYNTVGVMLGTGWFSGYLGFNKGYQSYGHRESFLMELHIKYGNGSRQIIKTDNTWKATTGPIIYSDFQQGELVYENRINGNWLDYHYNDSKWSTVNSVIINKNVSLIAERSDPVVEVRYQNYYIDTWELSPGVWIYDFGSNFAGYVEIKLENFTSIARIQVRHAEMIYPNGSLYTENLREARSTDTYVLNDPSKREELIVLKPHFTYHGFRYVEVSGYPKRLDKGLPNGTGITGVRIGLRAIRSQIVTDNKLINTLFDNIRTSNIANFISVPTDCPQRDERLGWMADAQVFAPTAIYNGDVAGFYSKWLRDVREAQSGYGAYSDVSPRIVDPMDGSPAWGDAGVIVVWHLYRMYGDKQIVEENYEHMKKYVDYILSKNPGLIWLNATNINFGDWLNVNEDTPKDVLATAYFAYDSLLLSKMAKVIGKTSDADKYRKLHSDISSKFNSEFVNATNGKIKGDSQTSYLLAVAFKIIPSELVPKALNNLVENIKRHDWHLTTGFAGVGYLLPVLSEYGYNDLAYKLLQQKTYPSWGFMIDNNATSMWERWDGYSKEKGFQDPSMNSFNHYSFGSVGRWLYQYMVGIDTDEEEVGFEKIIIKPHIGVGVNRVSAYFSSVQGDIGVVWTVDGNTFNLSVSVPSKAVIVLPFMKEKWTKEVPVGIYHFSVVLD